MDFLDSMKIMDEEVLTGTYFEQIPETPKDKGVFFEYDIVDESDKSYARLLNNIQTEETFQTIKTDDSIDFKVKGYVVTQDGLLWQIAGIIKRLKHDGNKEALRIIKETIQTSRIIRLTQVENPWELR
ncbi:MAG: hypothetical protein J6V66_00755 [Clostridia bacterium]|nr:hypothetical protein [Clostridia bacterium]